MCRPTARAISTTRPTPVTIVNEYFPNLSYLPSPSVFWFTTKGMTTRPTLAGTSGASRPRRASGENFLTLARLKREGSDRLGYELLEVRRQRPVLAEERDKNVHVE